jgi:hypothetical protein
MSMIAPEVSIRNIMKNKDILMKFVKKIAAISSVVLMTGCASGLNSLQEREYSAFERDGVLIEEKNATTGVVLGFLPGGGSFYAGEPALGILNLLMWPASILWDPISGKNGAMVTNYDVTKHHLKVEKEKEIAALEDRLSSDEINAKQYAIAKRKITTKYNY